MTARRYPPHRVRHPEYCSVEGCEKNAGDAKGLCPAHYMRWYRYGDATHNWFPPVPQGMKRCSTCGAVRTLDDFPIHKGNRDGRQSYCRPCHREKVKAYKQDHPEWARESARLHNRRLREQVIEAYGGRCVCCGETTPEFLAIDHVDGGGREHRRQLKGAVYRWLRQNGYPREGFQILCHNCNMAKGFYGGCPHLRVRVQGAA